MNTMFYAQSSFGFIGDPDEATKKWQNSPYKGSFLGWCIANLDQHYPAPSHVLNAEYLESIGFTAVSDNGQYGVYHNKAGYVGRFYGPMSAGKRIITFNRNGNHVGIKEDAGTRTVFNGVIKHRDELEIILNAVS